MQDEINHHHSERGQGETKARANIRTAASVHQREQSSITTSQFAYRFPLQFSYRHIWTICLAVLRSRSGLVNLSSASRIWARLRPCNHNSRQTSVSATRQHSHQRQYQGLCRHVGRDRLCLVMGTRKQQMLCTQKALFHKKEEES